MKGSSYWRKGLLGRSGVLMKEVAPGSVYASGEQAAWGWIFGEERAPFSVLRVGETLLLALTGKQVGATVRACMWGQVVGCPP